MTIHRFAKALDQAAATGGEIAFWLRDDDAVAPSPALDRLLSLTASHGVPLVLAVIPENTGEALSVRLGSTPHARVAVHGWSHRNHAAHDRKKQELGLDRPLAAVTNDLAAGLNKLKSLHGERLLPMLVPPWNRIDPAIIATLPDLGFGSLSVFGRERQDAPIHLVNTHVDIMRWHGARGGRAAADLFGELADLAEDPARPPLVGILTHHLVHDATAWGFLDELLSLTARHAGCSWRLPPLQPLA